MQTNLRFSNSLIEKIIQALILKMLIFILTLICPFFVSVQETKVKISQPETALVLSGRGAKDFLLKGVLKVREKEGIPLI